MIEVRPAGPGVAGPSGVWGRLPATAAVALIAGAAGGLAAHQIDQVRQPAVVKANPTPVPSTSQVSGPALDVAGIVAKAEPAIVTIHGQVTQGFATRTVAGTGIVITTDGEVLTARESGQQEAGRTEGVSARSGSHASAR